MLLYKALPRAYLSKDMRFIFVALAVCVVIYGNVVGGGSGGNCVLFCYRFIKPYHSDYHAFISTFNS